MANGWFKTDLLGSTADGRTARARIAYAGDPGNRATLRILCEAGLALAFDGPKLPGAPKRGPGGEGSPPSVPRDCTGGLRPGTPLT